MLSPDDTTGSIQLLYRDDPESNNQFYVVQNPEPGTWKLITDASAALDTVGLTLIPQIRSHSNLEAVMDTVSVSGTNYLRVSGLPVQQGELVPGATLAAALIGPHGAHQSLNLLDDGVHMDGLAGDGVYAALAEVGDGTGVYGADVQATWLNAGESISRATVAGYSVTADVDLQLSTSGIFTSSPMPDSGEVISLGVMVHNLGSEMADSALVHWVLMGGGDIGQSLVSVPPHDSVLATVQWQAVGGDTVTVSATVVVGEGTESDYDNNFAARTVVLGPSVLAVPPREIELPKEFMALPLRPNPSHGTLEVRFRLPSRMRVDVDVFDVSGRRIRSISPGAMDAGERLVRWDGTDRNGSPVAHGIYLVRLRAGSNVRTSRVVMLR